MDVMGSTQLGDDPCVSTHDGDGNREEIDHRVEADWSYLGIHPEIPYTEVQDPKHDRGGGTLAVSLRIGCRASTVGWSTCAIAAGSHGASRAC